MAEPDIRLTEVRLGSDAEELVIEVLRSGRLAQGPKVEAFEDAFARLVGVRHAVAVSSGTTALVAAMQAIDLRPGDEVITTPFTFVATLNAILEAGATAKLVDIRSDDFTIDVDAIADAIGPRTRAIVPIHLYGYPADLPSISSLVEKRDDITVIEDAAQAHLAKIGDRFVGGFGLGVFSFYATKNATTGEGGVLTTNDDDIAKRLRLLRNQGMERRYVYELPGHNYRMTEMQAAIGLSQLAHLDQWTDQRRQNADALRAGLMGIEGVSVPRESPDRRHVYHQFTVRFDRTHGLDRDRVSALLAERGVESGVYYPRLCHDYPCYEGLAEILAADLTVARSATEEVLSLPVHPWLSRGDLKRVIDSVRDVVETVRTGAGAVA